MEGASMPPVTDDGNIERFDRLARMARVELSDDERRELLPELDAMLEFAGRLEEVDVADVPEWTPPVPPTEGLRPDEIRPSLPRDAALALAPAAQDGFFRVPRTVDEG